MKSRMHLEVLPQLDGSGDAARERLSAWLASPRYQSRPMTESYTPRRSTDG